MLERVFTPLGYEVEWTGGLLDERFPEWGDSCYVNLTIGGKARLRDLLRHIYVLVPVFDNRKHYWIGDEEVDKLLSHGEGWLENHPEKVFITRRYFSKFRSFTRLALKRLDRLDNGEGGAESGTEETVAENPEATEISAEISAEASVENLLRLNDERLLTVLDELKASNAKSVIDMGCGEGNLLKHLIKEKTFIAIAGTDVSVASLNRAKERLKLDSLSEEQKKRVTLFQSSLCCRDKRFRNYDAAALVEVIEHLDENRLSSLASVVFGDAAPTVVVITTPNSAYNVNYPGLAAGSFRHTDHRFEWNDAQFRAWAGSIAGRYGYSVHYKGIGAQDGERGTPTLMAVFNKNAGTS
jgi:3' terminal RNA ribose 2'-O-methyltransferase Hen1